MHNKTSPDFIPSEQESKERTRLKFRVQELQTGSRFAESRWNLQVGEMCQDAIENLTESTDTAPQKCYNFVAIYK